MPTTEQKIQSVNDSIKGALTGINDFIKPASEAEKVLKPIITEVSGVLGKICPIMGAVSGVLGVFNVFCPDPFQQEVLGALKDISNKLDDVEKEMDAHFKQLETIIDLDFLKNQLNTVAGKFNIEVDKLPVQYESGASNSAKNSIDQNWATYIGLNTNVQEQSEFYNKIQKGSSVHDTIKDLTTILVGSKNADATQNEASSSLLGLLTDKAIRQMDMSGGQLKPFAQRGTIDGIDTLLSNYYILESFFYKNFMIQYKSYKMWYDMLMYYHSVAYPLDATPIADKYDPDGVLVQKITNILDVMDRNNKVYNSVDDMPDFICVGRLGTTYDKSNRGITDWDEKALQDYKTNSYNADDYANYFQKFKEGNLKYTDDKGKEADSEVYLFVNKGVFADIIEVQGYFTQQLDLFVFQMERLVVSQMNLLAIKYSQDKLSPFVVAANEILGRAEYLRQSLSGNLFSPDAPFTAKPFLTGRVLIPNNVQLASSYIRQAGDLGMPVENDYSYGYGYDSQKNGFGYQFPILDQGTLQSYEDSWLKMYTFNFEPGAKACDLIPDQLNVMMHLQGGNYDGLDQGGTIYSNTVTLGGTTRTLYSFFVTPLFGSFNAVKSYLPQASLSGDYSNKGPWQPGATANGDGKFTLQASTDPSNGADYTDILKMMGVSIPVHFNGGHPLQIWVKSSLSMDISFYATNDTHEELDLGFTYLGTVIPAILFMDKTSMDDQKAPTTEVVLIGQHYTFKIDTDDYFDTTKPGAFRQTGLSPTFYNCAVNGLCCSLGADNLLWIFDAQGGPNHATADEGPYIIGGGHDYTFDGSFTAVLEIEEIRLFWDFPDTSKF